MDVLYVTAFWGSITSVLLLLGGLIVPVTPLAFLTAMTLGLMIMPVAAMSTAILFLVFVLDAVARSAGPEADREYLRFLNSWSWIFGLRRYYLAVLRPTLM